MESPSAVPVTGWHRHRQPRKGLNDYDTTNEEWGLSLATSGDRYLATSGDFLMATDSAPGPDLWIGMALGQAFQITQASGVRFSGVFDFRPHVCSSALAYCSGNSRLPLSDIRSLCSTDITATDPSSRPSASSAVPDGPPRRETAMTTPVSPTPVSALDINIVALNPQPLPPGIRINLVGLNPQPLPPDATITLLAPGPQPLPPDATINLVALNPQPIPPGARINLVALNPQPLVAGGSIDFVALNPQPLPPGEGGRSIDFVALNPQPLPPEPPGGG